MKKHFRFTKTARRPTMRDAEHAVEMRGEKGGGPHHYLERIMEYRITVDDDGAEMTIKIAHPGVWLKDEWDDVGAFLSDCLDEAIRSEQRFRSGERIAVRFITEGSKAGCQQHPRCAASKTVPLPSRASAPLREPGRPGDGQGS